MKLKSETKQVMIYLKNRFNVNWQDKTVLENCRAIGLNYDMVCRGLQRLHEKQVISRDSRGPKSSYIYSTQIGLGDVIDAIQGIDLENVSEDVKKALNNVKL